YNIKQVIRVHELNHWFKGTFGYWPANPKEPVLVDMGKASLVLQYIREVSIFRGHLVCGFDVQKIYQDEVAASDMNGIENWWKVLLANKNLLFDKLFILEKI
uniref:Uncharacterized protein n=1 Tax=Romanomermis culicivorax TaxID=13658 RepID=A0A915J978_ROMCU